MILPVVCFVLGGVVFFVCVCFVKCFVDADVIDVVFVTFALVNAVCTCDSLHQAVSLQRLDEIHG